MTDRAEAKEVRSYDLAPDFSFGTVDCGTPE